MTRLIDEKGDASEPAYKFDLGLETQPRSDIQKIRDTAAEF